MDFLNKILRIPLDQLPYFLITLIIAFTVHEFSHAYFANKFGDPTARLQGRLTLNPAVHFDLFGVILLLIAGFGWARPVPVNRDNFDKPRQMGIVVAAAGPLSNLLLGFLGTMIYVALSRFGILDMISNEILYNAVHTFFGIFNFWNFFLFLFNLLPLPPLDGYRILEDIVPDRARISLKQFEQWSVLIFLLILIIPQLRSVIIEPLYAAASSIYFQFGSFFLMLFGG
ncbi:site-2 protease family protein [Paenibacillus woosongensis]|uniref:Site-2 protease family protein n=1 Tax=Paenibacillus woosongensis TaxID=307580 RepID=A0AA95I2T3_9BACL|nr:site-2 protease family protein [Paenibacillus woosongensis]WHX47731.1 site-2 protease family protein [Paenibacillus woosongensis]